MAYLNYLASASEANVLALSRDASILLEPSLVVTVSHLIGYWVQVQPLGKLLGQALDGGYDLNSEFWHPLRPPVYHAAESVQTLHQQLGEAWQRALAEARLPEDDWFRVEIEKVLRVFGHASERTECVASVLDRPADRERSGRVRIPIRWPQSRG